MLKKQINTKLYNVKLLLLSYITEIKLKEAYCNDQCQLQKHMQAHFYVTMVAYKALARDAL